MDKNILINNHFARVPKTFAEDLILIDKTFGYLSDVVRNIVVFLTRRQTRSIFSDVIFTLDEFCKETNVDIKSLQRNLPKEIRDKIVGDAEANYQNSTGEIILQNSFELALWLATNRNLMMNRVTPDKKFIYEGIQIIKQFEIGADFSSKRKSKRKYLVVLSSAFKEHMLDNYNLLDAHIYRDIPNVSSYRKFYLYFSKIIVIARFKLSQGQEPKFLLSVDELCKIFGTECKSNAERKRLVTKILDTVLKSSKEPLFEYSYIKNGNRYAYHVLFDFTNIPLDKYDEGIIATFYTTLFRTLEQDFINDRFSLLPHAKRHIEFKRLMENKSETDKRNIYSNWIFNSEDNARRMQLFKETFIKVFKVPYDEVEQLFMTKEEF